ncbi:MAG: 3-hydroxyacyl-CoA dehydrogenase family protein [Solirubrobacteraceae bacterium]
MPYTLPADVDERPVAIDGAGTLGRKIATVFSAGGTDVRMFDVSAEQLEAARDHVAQQTEAVRQKLGLAAGPAGRVQITSDLGQAVRGAWMVIEAVPERLELKRSVFGELDRLADDDAILASNSSSFATGDLIDEVTHPERVLNTHYQQPPDLIAVELMSCGKTEDGLIETLMDTFPRYGLAPFHVRRNSDGFIFNRIWAAIKRECLMVVQEGVATPEDIDGMWDIWVTAGVAPFELMDRVGLDVVLDIEEHYAAARPGIPEDPRTLLREYIAQGRLGVKSGRGFYEHSS